MYPHEILSPVYNRQNPFLAKIKERILLSNPLSQKKIYHVVLDLKDSGIKYRVGESLAVYPQNQLHIIESLCSSFISTDIEIEKKGERIPLKNFLMSRANLNRINRSLLQLLLNVEISTEKRDLLMELLHPDAKEKFKNYVESKSIYTLIHDFSSVKLCAKEFCETLSPLLPRFYSIASSMNQVGSEAHLTIRLTEYEQDLFIHRGVCSYFLCESASLEESFIPIYLQQAEHFSLPEESFDKPIIMIGPGTGIAPFRGFMQERVLRGSPRNWIFFGERNKAYDFYYEDDWNFYINQNMLRLDTAFSRDQEKKLYVQDRIIEHGQEVWKWISSGSYVYVCGDASKMAKDVEQALITVIHIWGGLSHDDAKEFLKSLRKSHRYQKDVY